MYKYSFGIICFRFGVLFGHYELIKCEQNILQSNFSIFFKKENVENLIKNLQFVDSLSYSQHFSIFFNLKMWII